MELERYISVNFKLELEKEFSNFRGPVLICLSALDKTIGLIFCKLNCIGFPQGPES